MGQVNAPQLQTPMGYDPTTHLWLPFQIMPLQTDPTTGEEYAPLVVGVINAGTATRTNVVAAIADTLLLASNGNRKGAVFFNDSTAILYLALGTAAASTTSYSVQVAGNGYFELPPQPVYTGDIRGIWSSANGTCRITELS